MTSEEDKDLSAFIDEVVADAAVLVEENKYVTAQIRSSNSKVGDKQKDEDLHGSTRTSHGSNASVSAATHGESQREL